MTFLKLVCMALNSLSGGEFMCFHCWPWRYISSTKLWKHASSPVTIQNRKLYSSLLYYSRCCSDYNILFNFCSYVRLWDILCAQIFQYLRCSMKMVWAVPWLTSNMRWISSTVRHWSALTATSTAVTTARIMTKCACPGRLLSLNDTRLSWKSLLHSNKRARDK